MKRPKTFGFYKLMVSPCGGVALNPKPNVVSFFLLRPQMLRTGFKFSSKNLFGHH
jgi:hypothetical protein